MDLPQFASKSPLFGDAPPTLAIIELTGTACIQVLLTYLDEHTSADPRIRAALGLGPLFFAESHVRQPVALRELVFNGDPHKSRSSTCAILVGGDSVSVQSFSRRLSIFLRNTNWRIEFAHVGHSLWERRDHTGFLDGTSNLQELTPEQKHSVVFVQPTDDPLYCGSTFLVFRKYRERLELWQSLNESVQEHIIGRRKADGMFLNGSSQWSPDVWDTTPQYSHIRAVNPRSCTFSWQERLFRRSIPFEETDKKGNLVAGLLFIALVRNPVQQVETLHNERLMSIKGNNDLLLSSGYVVPTRTAVYVLPSRASPAWQMIFKNR